MLIRITHTRCLGTISIALLSVGMMLMTALWGCEKRKEPIKVGFVGGLTGRLSDLGIDGRDGVILAVEEVNRAGGIRGRPVELISKDDRQDPETAVKVDKELIREGVVAIIGHMTSAMSMAVLPLINKEKVLMISPTTSANQLTGLDDYFVRVMPPNKSETDHLTRYACDKMGMRELVAVYDLSNRAYTEEFYQNLRSQFEKLGGRIAHSATFTSGSEVGFTDLARGLLKPAPDGLLVVAGAVDAAMICQNIRKAGFEGPILSCGWAMTDDLLRYGGRAVEGVVFSQLADRGSQKETYVRFKERFSERFGREPSFAALHGYEAGLVLFNALSKNDDPGELKATILEQRIFQGVPGDFELDNYGDPQRKRFLITVRNGQFKGVE